MQTEDVVIQPWRALGREIPLDTRDFQEIGRAVGFYRVEERPLFTDHSHQPIEDHKALVRTDSGEALSVVGASYAPIQFEQVAETLVKAADEIGLGRIFRTAGLFGKNGRVHGSSLISGSRS